MTTEPNETETMTDSQRKTKKSPQVGLCQQTVGGNDHLQRRSAAVGGVPVHQAGNLHRTARLCVRCPAADHHRAGHRICPIPSHLSDRQAIPQGTAKIPAVPCRCNGGVLCILPHAGTAQHCHLDHCAAVHHQYPRLRGQHHGILQQYHEIPEQRPRRTDSQTVTGQRHQSRNAPHQVNEPDHLHSGRSGHTEYMGKRADRRCH